VEAIRVHEFVTLDGVIYAPEWSFDYGFLPEMEASLGAVTERSRAILLGRKTYKEFEPAWSTRTVEDDPLTRGSGPRLFPEDAAPGKLSLAASESYENGVVYLAYRPQGEVTA
jgi:dihydrofolate reductase